MPSCTFGLPRFFRNGTATAAAFVGATVAFGAVCGAASPALAMPFTFHVTVQTGGLQGLGIFSLDFLLQNGAVANPLQANIRNFTMMGGNLIGAGGPTAQSTPVVGDLASSLRLSTFAGDDVGDFVQDFQITNAVSQIAFDVTISANAVQASSADPDFFSFFISDNNGTPLSTNAPDNKSLVFAPFDQATPQAQTFNSVSPSVIVQAVGTPEPNTLVLLGAMGGSVAAGTWGAWRKRKNAASSKNAPLC